MSLPSEVTVGLVKYRVHEVVDLLGTGDEGESVRCNGRVRASDAAIWIDEALEPQIKPITLMHEIIHAILEQSGHDDHPEGLVRCLSYGLLAFMRDNVDWVYALLNPVADKSEFLQKLGLYHE